MSLKPTLVCLALLWCSTAIAQKGIGTDTPNSSSALHVDSPNKGVLIPSLNLTNSSTFSPITGTSSSSHNGLLVWNHNTSTNNGLAGTGYYFWQNTTTPGVGSWYKLNSTEDGVLPASGTVTNSTLRWDGTGWAEATTLLSSPTGVSISVSTTLATTTLGGVLQDYEGNNGSAGQVLSSTGTSTKWIMNASGGLTDSDGDTQIQFEEGNDDDTIRFDTAGTERVLIDSNGNLGVNTATPSYTLDVYGTQRVRGLETTTTFSNSNKPPKTTRNSLNTANFEGPPNYTGHDAVFYTTFTTGGDITTGQVIYEVGGTGIGTALGINAGNFEIYAGSTGTVFVSTAVLANTAYSVAVVYDLTDDEIRFYLKQTGNVPVLSGDLAASGGFTENDWAGSDITGVGTVAGGTRSPYSGNFLGSGLNQIDFYTTDDINKIVNIAGTTTSVLTHFVVKDDGKVGIATGNPSHTLTVSGTAQVIGALHDSDGDAGSDGQVLSSTVSGTNWVVVSSDSVEDADGNTQIQVEEGANDDTIRFDTNGSERMTIESNGNVGIGLSTAPAYLLDVGGDINTSGDIRKSGTAYGHPDYVFEQYFDGESPAPISYRMFSLPEVEAFIKANKHLPGVQSRADIAAEGSWDVTENVRTNLEKVEELYLHTIAQQKRIDQQQQQLEEQAATIAEQQQQINELYGLLKQFLAEEE